MRSVPGGRGVVIGTKEDFSDAVYPPHPTVANRLLGVLCPFASRSGDVNLFREVFFMKNQNNLNKLKLVAVLAMLAALSIISGKFLGINVGEFMRFSLENMPIILAGMAFGPMAGLTVGILSDLVGCVMMGWTPIPWVTVGAGAIGALAGGVSLLMRKSRLPSVLITAVSVFVAHFVGSVLIKTIGLSAFYALPYVTLMLWRMLNYAVVGVIDGAIVHLLLKNKGIIMHINEIGGKRE